MKFEHNGDQFAIEFKRHFGIVPDRPDLPLDQTTKHKYTTVNLVKVVKGQPNEVFRTATVGCYHKDGFTLEEGRKAALRLMTKAWRGEDKALKSKVWVAYMTRGAK